jgi:hypothetical protein
MDVLKFLAVVTGSLFAGAALYINIAEHPARMLLETRNAALQWAQSYKRATWLQAPLAVISFLAGAAVWFTVANGGGSDRSGCAFYLHWNNADQSSTPIELS